MNWPKSSSGKHILPDKFYTRTGIGSVIQLKCKTTSSTTYINRDSEAQDDEVFPNDLSGSILQIVIMCRFNTSPTGKKTVALVAKSVVVLKKAKGSTATAFDHDDLVSMAV
jgi:hypothetical protein